MIGKAAVDRAKVARSGAATATAPGAIAVSGAATIQLTGAAPARSYYREQVAQIAAGQLLDRGAELDELAEFCTTTAEDAPAYRWWRAPKWSGKTALMAAFVLDPPPGIRVVAFFVTARWAGHDTRTAFIDIVGDQLAEILEEPTPTGLPPHVRDSYFNGLLSRAADRCVERGERLILVVDGLDEDRGTPHDQPGQGTSIAAALPTRPPPGLRIVVSGRPNPRLPADTLADHPLHDEAVRCLLIPSPHAKIAEDYMLLELDRLLRAGPSERDLLGLLTAARGGLATSDLAELTDQSSAQVRRYLRTVASRTFDTRSGHWRPDTEVHLLGHEDLQVIAAEELGDRELDAYRARMHIWAERYRALGWPAHTPEYLLRGYHRMLADVDDVPRMVALIADPARQDRMLDLSGGDATALAEIITTQDHILRQDRPDLLALLRLAIHRDHLVSRNEQIPIDMPAHWVRRGHIDRALALANSIVDPVVRSAVMGQVARAMVSTGRAQQARVLVDQTETNAHKIADPFKRSQALMHVVAVVATDDLDRAEVIANGIPDRSWQIQALSGLVKPRIERGDIARARVLVDRAEATMRSVIESGGQSWPLMSVVRALVQIGALGTAESLIRDLQFDHEQWAFLEFVEVLAKAGHFDYAELLTKEIFAPWRQARLLGNLAAAAARHDNRERAQSLVVQSEHVIRGIDDLGVRMGALANLALEVARSGDREHVNSMVAIVEGNISEVVDSHIRMRVLKDVAMAIAEIGDVKRAEVIARSISDSSDRTWALSAVAMASVRAGDLSYAELLVREFADVSERPHPRTQVAEAIADAGDLVRAERVARDIVSPRTREVKFWRVVDALVRIGDLEQAEAIARDDIAPSWQQGPLASVAAAYAQADHTEQAERILRDIANSGHEANTLRHIAAAHARKGKIELAYELMDRAEAAADCIMDFEEKVEELKGLTELFVEMGDRRRLGSLVDRVADTAHHLSADGRALALAWVAEMHVYNEDLERADRVIEEITEPVSRLWVLTHLVGTFARINDTSRVQKILDHAEIIARGHTDSGDQVLALIRVAEAALQLENLELARSLIEDATVIAQGIAKSEVRHWAVGQVAEALVRVGELNRALLIARGFDTLDRQSRALAGVAITIAQCGDAEQAQSIANEIMEPDQRAETMLALALLCSSRRDEVDDVELYDHPSVSDGDNDRADLLWRLIAESLRRAKWDECLDIIVLLMPSAVTVALREVDTLGWRPSKSNNSLSAPIMNMAPRSAHSDQP